jgi:phenylpropionate dioxygenase-like ring-hydroxylating dioxygenase large terminal subunit
MVFRLLSVRFRGAPCATRIPRNTDGGDRKHGSDSFNLSGVCIGIRNELQRSCSGLFSACLAGNSESELRGYIWVSWEAVLGQKTDSQRPRLTGNESTRHEDFQSSCRTETM